VLVRGLVFVSYTTEVISYPQGKGTRSRSSQFFPLFEYTLGKVLKIDEGIHPLCSLSCVCLKILEVLFNHAV